MALQSSSDVMVISGLMVISGCDKMPFMPYLSPLMAPTSFLGKMWATENQKTQGTQTWAKIYKHTDCHL